MDSARRGRIELERRLPVDGAPKLADDVLRELRSSRSGSAADDPLGEWIRLGRWMAGAACIIAIGTAVIVPKLPAPDEPNPLAALGGW